AGSVGDDYGRPPRPAADHDRIDADDDARPADDHRARPDDDRGRAAARHDDRRPTACADDDDAVTHVLVLQGGRSGKHDASLASAESVVDALRKRGHDVDTIELARGASWLPDATTTAAISGADVVFPVLHGPFGEDGSVQGLLELADVPYVGAGVTA